MNATRLRNAMARICILLLFLGVITLPVSPSLVVSKTSAATKSATSGTASGTGATGSDNSTGVFTRPSGYVAPAIDLPNLSSQFGATTTFQQIFVFVVGILALIAGIAAFGYVLYGGYKYITSGGNPQAAEEGKRMIVGAIVGIVIISLAYVTVRYIFLLFGGL